MVRDEVIVPSVTGKRATEALRVLREAGLGVQIAGVEVADGLVLEQDPAPGRLVAPGSLVSLAVQPPVRLPQDLGDLGDGREFGGIRLDYLPEGLVWGRWSGKDGFGEHSYITSFDKPGKAPGHYSVQVIVLEGGAVEKLNVGSPEDGAQKVDVGGKEAYLARVTDAGEPAAADDPAGTLTIAWELRDDLAVEVCLSPDYVKEVDGPAELKKIAEGVRATG